MARRMDETRVSDNRRRAPERMLSLAILFLATVTPVAVPAHAGELDVPPEIKQGLEQMYGGDPDAAIGLAQKVQQQQPGHPIGYLLEAEARWWKIYCAACEVKWGMVDAWRRPRRPEDEPYLALLDKAIRLAEAEIEKSDTARMQLYAGMGWALRARLYGLRDERSATARAGVRAREHFLRASQLDPGLADAYTGLGLYNYYVDALSPFVKFIRFFMGIPGGNKKEGIRQLQKGMNEGELTAVEARFYLAKNLRTYDLRYEDAEQIVGPLVERYPRNPLFLLLLGNLNAELSRNEKAATSFRAAQQLTIPNPACAARVQQVLKTLTVSLH